MTDDDLKNAVKAISEKIDTINEDIKTLEPLKEKLNTIYPKPDEKEDSSGWEALKLFFFSIMGGVVGILTEFTVISYVNHSQSWWIFLLLTIAIPLVFSYVFYYLIYPLRKRVKKKIPESNTK